MSLIPIKHNQTQVRPNPASPPVPAKTKPATGTTQSQLRLLAVQSGVALLKDGSLRLVLMTSAVNFALKNDDEQNALIYAYQNFLNSLTFPIQIVIQSRHLNLKNYLIELENRMQGMSNELLQIQIKDYIDFIKKMLQVANIMDKKFYLVIPYFPTQVQRDGLIDKFSQFMMAAEHEQAKYHVGSFDRFRKELIERASVVASGLASLDIRAIQLSSREIVELLYKTYNPETKALETIFPTEQLEVEISRRTEK